VRWCLLLVGLNILGQFGAVLAYAVLTRDLLFPPDRPWYAWLRQRRTEGR
jgi:hypothetical protein